MTEAATEAGRQAALYEEAVAAHAAALARLARGYEADRELCRDLQQEIHVRLWQSLARFDGRCSLRTWVYRVAHNVACTHVTAQRRRSVALVTLEELDASPADADHEAVADRRHVCERLQQLIQQLAPIDRQLILLHLEGFEVAAMAEVSGLSVGNVNTKLCRIRKVLAKRVQRGGV